MLLETTQHSKTKRDVTIIAGFIKPSGTICAQIANDQGKRYFIVIRPDGEMSCHESNRIKCQALVHGRRCYHVDRVLAAQHTFMTDEETLLPDEQAAIAEERNMQKLTAYRAQYDVLAASKQTREQRENAAAWARYNDNYGI